MRLLMKLVVLLIELTFSFRLRSETRNQQLGSTAPDQTLNNLAGVVTDGDGNGHRNEDHDNGGEHTPGRSATAQTAANQQFTLPQPEDPFEEQDQFDELATPYPSGPSDHIQDAYNSFLQNDTEGGNGGSYTVGGEEFGDLPQRNDDGRYGNQRTNSGTEGAQSIQPSSLIQDSLNRESEQQHAERTSVDRMGYEELAENHSLRSVSMGGHNSQQSSMGGGHQSNMGGQAMSNPHQPRPLIHRGMDQPPRIDPYALQTHPFSHQMDQFGRPPHDNFGGGRSPHDGRSHHDFSGRHLDYTGRAGMEYGPHSAAYGGGRGNGHQHSQLDNFGRPIGPPHGQPSHGQHPAQDYGRSAQGQEYGRPPLYPQQGGFYGGPSHGGNPQELVPFGRSQSGTSRFESRGKLGSFSSGGGGMGTGTPPNVAPSSLISPRPHSSPNLVGPAQLSENRLGGRTGQVGGLSAGLMHAGHQYGAPQGHSQYGGSQSSRSGVVPQQPHGSSHSGGSHQSRGGRKPIGRDGKSAPPSSPNQSPARRTETSSSVAQPPVVVPSTPNNPHQALINPLHAFPNCYQQHTDGQETSSIAADTSQAIAMPISAPTSGSSSLPGLKEGVPVIDTATVLPGMDTFQNAQQGMQNLPEGSSQADHFPQVNVPHPNSPNESAMQRENFESAGSNLQAAGEHRSEAESSEHHSSDQTPIQNSTFQVLETMHQPAILESTPPLSPRGVSSASDRFASVSHQEEMSTAPIEHSVQQLELAGDIQRLRVINAATEVGMEVDAHGTDGIQEIQSTPLDSTMQKIQLTTVDSTGQAVDKDLCPEVCEEGMREVGAMPYNEAEHPGCQTSGGISAAQHHDCVACLSQEDTPIQQGKGGDGIRDGSRDGVVAMVHVKDDSSQGVYDGLPTVAGSSVSHDGSPTEAHEHSSDQHVNLISNSLTALLLGHDEEGSARRGCCCLSVCCFRDRQNGTEEGSNNGNGYCNHQ